MFSALGETFLQESPSRSIAHGTQILSIKVKRESLGDHALWKAEDNKLWRSMRVDGSPRWVEVAAIEDWFNIIQRHYEKCGFLDSKLFKSVSKVRKI